ncbi:PIN domain-containing protein [Pendulispora brunnea]|uniref:PIN domain-containing protein n=1 Tax=Pendulispora brunnea TaxID=2905690 RepID=A0ABZ2KEH7_9BACT
MFLRVLHDTNVWIDWLRKRARSELLTGPGFIREVSSVVLMELRAGARSREDRRTIAALAKAPRLIVPTADMWLELGGALFELRRRGFDVTSASFVNDVLIAISCRHTGAQLLTANAADFEAIARVIDFRFRIV